MLKETINSINELDEYVHSLLYDFNIRLSELSKSDKIIFACTADALSGLYNPMQVTEILSASGMPYIESPLDLIENVYHKDTKGIN